MQKKIMWRALNSLAYDEFLENVIAEKSKSSRSQNELTFQE